MGFKREWAIGSWENRATLTYSEIDKAITMSDGRKFWCDTYGRKVVLNPNSGAPRPIINLDDTSDSVWYMSFSSEAEQAVIRITFD